MQKMVLRVHFREGIRCLLLGWVCLHVNTMEGEERMKSSSPGSGRQWLICLWLPALQVLVFSLSQHIEVHVTEEKMPHHFHSLLDTSNSLAS